MSKEEVLMQLQAQSEVYEEFLRLNVPLQEEFLEFCMGNRGIHVTYDSVFKHIFDPEQGALAIPMDI